MTDYREDPYADQPEMHEHLRRRLFAAAQVPSLYADANEQDWRGSIDAGKRKAFAELLSEMGNPEAVLARPRNVVLVGPPGTGKTRASIAVGRRWSDGGRRWRHESFDAIGRRVRATYNNRADETESEVIGALCRDHLLILDDVGAGAITDWSRGLTHAVIDGRYGRGLPTILVTNLRAEELETTIGERAVDRLREGGGRVIVFPGPSLRATLKPPVREVPAVNWYHVDNQMNSAEGRGWVG
jgi:DNA replication protein DnaC